MKNKTFYAVKLQDGSFVTDLGKPRLFNTKAYAELILSSGRKIVRVELREIKPKRRKKT